MSFLVNLAAAIFSNMARIACRRSNDDPYCANTEGRSFACRHNNLKREFVGFLIDPKSSRRIVKLSSNHPGSNEDGGETYERDGDVESDDVDGDDMDEGEEDEESEDVDGDDMDEVEGDEGLDEGEEGGELDEGEEGELDEGEEGELDEGEEGGELGEDGEEPRFRFCPHCQPVIASSNSFRFGDIVFSALRCVLIQLAKDFSFGRCPPRFG